MKTFEILQISLLYSLLLSFTLFYSYESLWFMRATCSCFITYESKRGHKNVLQLNQF